MANLEEIRAQANSALATGDHTTALSLATVMRSHFPHDYLTTELMGKIYVESHRLREATETFQALLEVDPESVVAWSALGMIAEDAGDLNTALDYFDHAFDIDPGNHEIAAEIKRISPATGRAKAQEPGSSMHSMGRHFLLEKKYESALPWLQEAVRIAPESVEIAVALARALWLAWRPAEAGEIAREVLARHPQCLRALVVAAGTARSKGGAEVTSMLDRAAALNPGNAIARNLFQEAGLAFPERFESLEIPDDEVAAALAAAAAGEAPAEPEATPATPAEEEAQADTQEQEQRVSDEAANPPQAAETAGAEETAPNPLLMRLRALREPTSDDGETSEAGVSPEPVEPRIRPSEPPQLIFEPSVKGRQAARLAPEPPPAEAAPEPPAEVVPELPPAHQARQRIAAAAVFADQGLVDMAISTYGEALKLDPASAQEIAEAVQALADANPRNAAARWLAGDAMAADGKFRRAVEQYLQVLRADGSAASGPSAVQQQD